MQASLVLRPLRFLAVPTVLLALMTFNESSDAQQIPPPQVQAKRAPLEISKGLVVIAQHAEASPAAWQVASIIYRTPNLRPELLDDASARVLAGEPSKTDAAAHLKELANLREFLGRNDATAKKHLAVIAKTFGASGALVVRMASANAPRARVYVLNSDSFAEPELWPQPDASSHESWAQAVAWLRENAAAARSNAEASRSKSAFSSPWLWGALGATAGAFLLVYATRGDDSPNTIHLSGRVAQ